MPPQRAVEMNTFRPSNQQSLGAPVSRLTRLYSETKHSLQAALPARRIIASPEKQSLDRKYRNQKDRLIAWGLEWRDESNDGDIDKSVGQAGLTEVVESVLENINGMLDEVERMNSTASTEPTDYPIEKPTASSRGGEWTTADLARYEDLVGDLTSAIDLLCDLSKSRRTASVEQAEPSSSKGKAGTKHSVRRDSRAQRTPSPVPAYDSDPASRLSIARGLGDEAYASDLHLTMVEPSLLVLPQEGPPTYGDSKTFVHGAASAPIVFGHVRQTGGTLLPIMVEYARFDRIYRDTTMPLPMSRLEYFHAILGSPEVQSSSAFSRPIACFEDPQQPRYGLIYELPPPVRELQQQAPSQMFHGEPKTLSQLLLETSKISREMTVPNVAPNGPPLEERFRLALQLVQGFSILAQHNFPHRNVSSSSVALFPRGSTPQSQRFDVRRPMICSTDLFSEFDMDPPPEILQQNIYRHPDDPRIKGPTAASEYQQRFDLYSLSLVLLEIGIWVPLAEIYKEKYSLQDFKLRVEKLWIRRELPQKCGTLYSRCVKELFQAGDVDQSEQSPQQLTRVLERVRVRLERCCSIDDIEGDEDELEINAEDVPPATPQRYGNEMVISPTTSPFPAEKQSLTLDTIDTTQAGDETRTSPRNIFTDTYIPDTIQTQYEMFEGRLLKIVSLALRHSQESSWVDLHYTGETKETSRPTICVGCTSTKRVRLAIKKNLKYDTSIFDLAVIKDAITRSKSIARRSQASPDDIVMNPGHHEKPLCGSSIGAWRYAEHSPAVTFGGVVLVDGAPYGMTVHHLLEDPDAEAAYNKAAAASSQVSTYVSGNPNALNDDDDESDGSDDDEFATALSETLSFTSESGSEQGEDEDATTGIPPNSGHHIILTQPALDDTDADFFPSAEDKDEDHIDSHRLGHVYASSGLRRSVPDAEGTSHEIDWLLLELDDERLQPFNVIAGGKQFCAQSTPGQYRPHLREPVCRQEYPATEDLYPRRVMPSSALSGLSVHCTGRTSGLGDGRISQRMRWVRFQGRISFSKVWSASGTFGAGGDSGAWVVSNEGARICGHVLAYSERFQVAYISPMEVMFEDMRTALGVRAVELPGSEGWGETQGAGKSGVGLAVGQPGSSASARQHTIARKLLPAGNFPRAGQVATT